MIKIVEVKTKKELKKFIYFPLKLYKNSETESKCFKSDRLVIRRNYHGNSSCPDRIYSDQRYPVPEAKLVCMGIQYG